MIKKYFGIIFVLIVSVLIYIFRNQLIKFQSYGYFGLFMLNLLGSATLAVPTPLFLTTVVAGSVFNPYIVAIISSLASTLGELTGYWAGIGAGEIIMNGKYMDLVKSWFEKYGLITLFLMALIPNPIFDVAGLFAGATKIPVKKYLLYVGAGKIIRFSVLAFSGYFVLH